MERDIADEIQSLKNQPLEALTARYKEVFGVSEAPSSNKVFLWRKISYRLQEIEHGGLSKRTLEQIDSLIKQYDPINNTALRPESETLEKIGKDRRLPIPGTVITKLYKGTTFTVRVLERGFEYNGELYNSLSAIAKDITGAHWNGYGFFNL
jgi:hypothetical protein